MKYDDLKYLSVQLPEDILKEKWSGNFERASKIIKERLKDKTLIYSMKCRLELELAILENLKTTYIIDETEAVKRIRLRIPEFSGEEFETLRMEGKIDWIYYEGKTMFPDSFDATLFKVYPELWRRTAEGDTSDYHVLDELVETIENGQDISAHIHIRHRLSISDSALYPGKAIRVHMPVPLERDGIENLRILSISPEPAAFPSAEAIQPAVYFETKAYRGMSFSIEYELDNHVRYVDTSKIKDEDIEKGVIPNAVKKYMGEELPHIRFTPYIKAMAEEIAGGETNPLKMARCFYDFITTKTDYRFVRDYASIDNLSEYCALNYRGDCGIQALLFITLCRISGIPAKWQSGLDAKPSDIGEHDWAMFYIPSAGWLYADLSYGGSSYIRKAYDRWNFFFGNVDPYRIPINRDFQRNFEQPKKMRRFDPYDNQCGEAEYDEKGVYGAELIYEYDEIEIYLNK